MHNCAQLFTKCQRGRVNDGLTSDAVDAATRRLTVVWDTRIPCTCRRARTMASVGGLVIFVRVLLHRNTFVTFCAQLCCSQLCTIVHNSQNPEFLRISSQDSAGVRNFEENPLRAFVRLASVPRTVLVRLPTDIAIPPYKIKNCAHVSLCTIVHKISGGRNRNLSSGAWGYDPQ